MTKHQMTKHRMTRPTSREAETGSARTNDPARPTDRRAQGNGVRPVDQGERFLEAAHDFGGGVSPEQFAELIGAIAKARLPKATGAKPKKQRPDKPKLIRLRSGC